MPLLIISYFLSLGCLIGVSFLPQYRKYYLISKACTSFLLVVIAYFTIKDQMVWSWMLAFVFCFIGDVVLGLDEKKEQSFYFLSGLSAFVFGHLLFIYTLHQRVPLQLSNLVFPFFMCLVAARLIALPQFHVKGKEEAIVIYACIISLLLVKGIEMVLMDSAYIKLFFGTFSFLVSDFILLFLYFYQPKIKQLKALNLMIYYLAVFLLAISIV